MRGTIRGSKKHQAKSALVFVSTLDDHEATVKASKGENTGRPTYDSNKSRIVGLGTYNPSTVAAMMAAAKALKAKNVNFESDIVFAAVGSEETGYLDGMEMLYGDLAGEAAAFVDLLGDGREIWSRASGRRAYVIRATGPTGHTLRTGGLPNVNQAISRAVDRILGLQDTLPKALNDGDLTRQSRNQRVGGRCSSGTG